MTLGPSKVQVHQTSRLVCLGLHVFGFRAVAYLWVVGCRVHLVKIMSSCYAPNFQSHHHVPKFLSHHALKFWGTTLCRTLHRAQSGCYAGHVGGNMIFFPVRPWGTPLVTAFQSDLCPSWFMPLNIMPIFCYIWVHRHHSCNNFCRCVPISYHIFC